MTERATERCREGGPKCELREALDRSAADCGLRWAPIPVRKPRKPSIPIGCWLGFTLLSLQCILPIETEASVKIKGEIPLHSVENRERPNGTTEAQRHSAAGWGKSPCPVRRGRGKRRALVFGPFTPCFPLYSTGCLLYLRFMGSLLTSAPTGEVHGKAPCSFRTCSRPMNRLLTLAATGDSRRFAFIRGCLLYLRFMGSLLTSAPTGEVHGKPLVPFGPAHGP